MKNFKKVFLFIVLLLLILGTTVFAARDDEVVGTNEDIVSALKELTEYKSKEYFYIFRVNTAYEMFFINKSDYPDFKLYLSENVEIVRGRNGYGFYNNYNNVNALLYTYNSNTKKFENKTNVSFGHSYHFVLGGKLIMITNTNIYKDNTYTTIFYSPEQEFIEPYILDTDENLSKLNMENITIDCGSLNSYDNLRFYVFAADRGSTILKSLVYNTNLDNSSSFRKAGGVNGDYFEIPTEIIKNLLQNGQEVTYNITWGEGFTNNSKRTVVYNSDLSITHDEGETPSEGEVINNTINSRFNILQKFLQTKTDEEKQRAIENAKKLDEAQETRKGILATIKEVVSYINPLSENFFVYKLIDLLVDALKKLFIPNDEFFSNYFNDLKDWFSARFGFLAYPLELVLDILNRILIINFTEPAFNIPEIAEPITNTKLISATSFNFNTLLENVTLKTVHDTYLILVDAVIIFNLVNLAKSKFEEVMTK